MQFFEDINDTQRNKLARKKFVQAYPRNDVLKCFKLNQIRHGKEKLTLQNFKLAQSGWSKIFEIFPNVFLNIIEI